MIMRIISTLAPLYVDLGTIGFGVQKLDSIDTRTGRRQIELNLNMTLSARADPTAG